MQSEFRTPYLLYVLMRRMYGYTRGYSNNFLSWIISIIKPPYKDLDFSQSEIFKGFDENKINAIVKGIELNGYHVFDVQLSPENIEELVQFAKTAPTRYLLPQPDIGKYEQKFSSEKRVYDSNAKGIVKWSHDVQDLVDSPAVQKYIFDPVLMGIAQSYLKSIPIWDSIALWWSQPATSEKEKAAAAQLFHFDMDRIKFLKFFFYLTDVTNETGPHCYVQGTHKNAPARFYKDRRFSDQEVKDAFGNRVLELCGKKGTVMAVDTRGLHKGLSLEKGERLLLQLEFTNSLFGQTYERVSGSKVIPQYVEVIKKFPAAYTPLLKS